MGVRAREDVVNHQVEEVRIVKTYNLPSALSRSISAGVMVSFPRSSFALSTFRIVVPSFMTFIFPACIAWRIFSLLIGIVRKREEFTCFVFSIEPMNLIIMVQVDSGKMSRRKEMVSVVEYSGLITVLFKKMSAS